MIKHSWKDFGLGKSESDHNMYCSIHNSLQVIVILYVDDLLLTGDDEPKLNLIYEDYLES